MSDLLLTVVGFRSSRRRRMAHRSQHGYIKPQVCRPLTYQDVYYDYLEQEILARSDTWAQKVLLVRATIAYLIRHSTGDINGALDRLMVDPGSLASALPSDLRNRTYMY